MAPNKRKRGRPKKAPRVRVALKGTREWKKWLDEFAALCGSARAATIDKALKHYAEVREFDGPPKR